MADSCQPCRTPGYCSNCASCCCAQTHSFWREGRIGRGLAIEYVGTAWMVLEVAGSLFAGIAASSFALIAFGSDSLVELLSALAVLVHLRKDSDGSPVTGGGTAKVTSYLLLALVPTIAVGSAYAYFVAGLRPGGSPLGLAIAAGAVAIMPFLWHEKRKIGRETNCLPLSIDAVASATCLLMSVALLAGLLVEYVFRVGWADLAATFVILAFVAREALESAREARSS